MVEVEVKSQNAMIRQQGLCGSVATRGAASPEPWTWPKFHRIPPEQRRGHESDTRRNTKLTRLRVPFVRCLDPTSTYSAATTIVILELAALHTLPAHPTRQSRKHRNHHNGLSTGTDARQQRRCARHQSRHPRRWPITWHSLPPSLPRPAKGIPHHPLTL